MHKKLTLDYTYITVSLIRLLLYRNEAWISELHRYIYRYVCLRYQEENDEAKSDRKARKLKKERSTDTEYQSMKV